MTATKRDCRHLRRLTDAQVEEIRERVESFGATYGEMAAIYGVSRQTVGLIVRREGPYVDEEED